MLETIWFLLWGVLWAVYFVLDGFDLGMGTLMPFLAKDEFDKRSIYNAGGPFWDGNEVWLLSAGGVTFAAFPLAYATMFSGLYSALMLLLFALILRGVSYEFRSKVDSISWRSLWDACHSVGSFLPALLLGVAFANLFHGLPLTEDHVNQAGLLDLLNPYGLLGGVLFVAMFAMHGALWLSIRATGDLKTRAVSTACKLWPVVLVLVLAFLAYTYVHTQLFGNYMKNPHLFLILIAAVAGLVASRLYLGAGSLWKAWGGSAVFIACVALFGVVGLFPAILISTLNPAWSLTIHNASSSALTLKIMLGVALVFVPVVIGYQAWALKTFSQPIKHEGDMEY
ncbi:MAG TPA: cytochrome d ubiquinol oxidase subunit II [Humidesulfovibrio sp.]|uniref:cytochrome d ubiquinol oxidase subunit II n=1 Tax=Humidesulfovibrio sp. TaxID=2910988 RepID=UPI002B85FE1E|nr:cytochrome d ubiquinol oxidase subunit II [Humidesulfovibrio sp.]HWR03158.1 cytochrome d ubiquinol oxidase subunit II [Humidesulfovibrio sp.]